LVKAKLTRVQEFVIGGYTPPEGSCKHFGALRPAGATQCLINPLFVHESTPEIVLKPLTALPPELQVQTWHLAGSLSPNLLLGLQQLLLKTEQTAIGK
jgi:hypothetical protein